ncbi:hypothetical protein MTR67_022583 [Solanum verrucosum]|uniref:Uncharacterized protein n=1 Tax=Solanum verrucosum TaxID=315347 RepID=A0AAF0TY01_SOLVR|nr:hypothetical protein MTR67_022583 [Solanum verrucosum]
MNPGNKKVMLTDLLSYINRKDMFHHLLVHLHQGTNVSTIVRILRTSELDLRFCKVVRHKAVLRLLHVLSVVGVTRGCVVMTPLVASSGARMVIFMRECPKNKQGSGNGGNRAQSSSVAPPDRAAPIRVTSGTGGGSNHLYAITSR